LIGWKAGYSTTRTLCITALPHGVLVALFPLFAVLLLNGVLAFNRVLAALFSLFVVPLPYFEKVEVG
jgi:hypothetical protein